MQKALPNGGASLFLGLSNLMKNNVKQKYIIFAKYGNKN